MAFSKSEQVLRALHACLVAALPGVKVERNEPIPLTIPPSGMVILRDGDPGEAEVILSGLSWYYEHRAEAEVYVDLATAAQRDAQLDAIKQGIAAGLEADRTLGGLVDFAHGENPYHFDLAAEGAPGVKAAAIIIVLPYDTSDPLA